MNSLINNFESAIQSAIEEYSKLICSKFPTVNPVDLESIWNEVSEGMKISVVFKSTPKNNSKDSDTFSVKSLDESCKCPYKFTKGVNSGNSCGNNTKGGSYCSRHKKYEDTEQKTKKVIPVSSKKTEPTKIVPVVVSAQKVLKKNKIIDKLWHPDTGLVFRSSKERVVIGKCEDSNINPLTEEDIETCKKWGFIFDKDQKQNKTIVEHENTKSVKTDVEDVENLLNELQKSNFRDGSSLEELDEELEEEDLED